MAAALSKSRLMQTKGCCPEIYSQRRDKPRMNLNLGNTASTWKQIKLQHLTAGAGLALAVSAVVALGGWQGGAGTQATSASPPAPRRLSIPRSAAPPEVVFYFVSSQAEADRAAFIEDDAIWARLAANEPEPARTVHILMAATAAEEAEALQVFLQNLPLVEGVAFSLVDLRGR